MKGTGMCSGTQNIPRRQWNPHQRGSNQSEGQDGIITEEFSRYPNEMPQIGLEIRIIQLEKQQFSPSPQTSRGRLFSTPVQDFW